MPENVCVGVRALKAAEAAMASFEALVNGLVKTLPVTVKSGSGISVEVRSL